MLMLVFVGAVDNKSDLLTQALLQCLPDKDSGGVSTRLPAAAAALLSGRRHSSWLARRAVAAGAGAGAAVLVYLSWCQCWCPAAAECRLHTPPVPQPGWQGCCCWQQRLLGPQHNTAPLEQ